MKLREVQMLGVLALAVVIIVLACRWGGSRNAVKEARQTETQQSGQQAMDDDLADLYKDLLADDAAAAGPAAPAAPGAEGVMQVGQDRQPAAGPSDEELAIRDFIETTHPDYIPLTIPPAASEQTSAAPAASSQAAAAQPAAAADVTHVVKRGETLSDISHKYYGTSHRWQAILDANRSVLSDPKALQVGMKLAIPGAQAAASAQAPASAAPAAAPRSPAGAAGRTHTVAKGDTLYRLAAQYYGNGSEWRRILAENRGVISSPQDMRAGMVLRIP